ncbi:MAG: hypothetical protein A3A08_00645 [Candidatus Nealsonbacteria bacterium RIFCSPLOWO2_01_FULL_41_9]|uniref:peptide chain release factor N(5)-glutamine methyltransferase n=1 Tax=Candidatus Nealsonbacteria bacterium RIFCSPLOWO2_01_FULL_41_9 TaxID=1801671 RepID=A0A1G2EBP5_9BACT|nr:MAG: hypothetical protein A3A08_00645 [Candidatus Nealsonbacteria bacterium RIFCSPLOWO2_01_FULL_41_9]
MKSVRFLNCQIDLSKWNFMPRAETEFWVGKVLKKLSFPKEAKLLKILDIFSGSGCIGIAILRACPEQCRRVDFADVDEKAIKQIKINLKLNKINLGRYKIYKSDLFKNLPKKNYDYIFANPPYVATERIREVQPQVLKYEPGGALFGGKKGLIYIRKFLKEAKNFLTGQGFIFLEFSPEQKEEIEKILLQEKYKKCLFFKDQFKKYRFLKCY